MPEEEVVISDTETQAAIDAGTELGFLRVGVRDVDGAKIVILKQDGGGYCVRDITDIIRNAQPAPDRIRATPTLHTVGSFCAYVRRFAGGGTLLFGDQSDNTVVAVLDYHEPGAPSWATHEAVLTLKASKEWQAWIGNNGKALDQAAFAEFLEDHAADVIEPTAAALQDTITNLELRRDVQFKSAVNLQDGTCRFLYEETERSVEGQITVPRTLTLALRCFEGQDPWQVTARLRYRMERGTLRFSYHLDRPERIAENAFSAVCKQIEQDAERPVLLGVA